MKRNMRNLLAKASALSVTGMALTAVNSMAAISTETETSIKAGISSADVLFFALGGSILVVMAGIWGGFKQVKKLFLIIIPIFFNKGGLVVWPCPPFFFVVSVCSDLFFYLLGLLISFF